MADRFPLILNTSTNQIQEIASGDSLDLTGTNIANAGIITAGNVTIGAATTDLIVNGDARITGILTIGTSSLKLDGPNNLVNVGTALTLGHTQGLQFHTQNLHSAGFEVNQINVSGASTMGGDVTFTGDNYNVLWDKSQNILEFSDNAKVSFGSDGDLFVFHDGSNSFLQDAGTGTLFLDCSQTEIKKFGSNHSIAKFIGGGAVELYHNNTKRFETTSSGVTITGDGTFTGNVSVGGTLTYEDVTNIDSVGIITAREGVFLPDLKQLKLGNTAAAPDLYLWHNSSTGNSNISNKTGDLFIQGNNGSGTVVNQIAVKSNAAVELNYQGDKKFETTSNGAKFTSSRVQFHNSTSSGGYAQFSNSSTSHNSASGFWIGVNSSQQGVIQNKENHPIKFYTNDTIRWDIESGGHFVPQTNDTYDIGTSSYKVRNVYATTFSGSITGTTGSFSGDATFNGGAGAITIAADSDIRFPNSPNWTGEYAGKIQYHNNKMYLQTGANGYQFRNASGGNILDLTTAGLITGDLSFANDVSFNSAGAGAITIAAGGDIRMSSGNWTGEHAGKIQFHSNKLYLQGGSSGHQLRDHSGGTTFEINPSGVCAGVNLSFSQDCQFAGGASAVSIAGGSDIRLSSGNWTGNAYGKIQHHSDRLYICGGSSSDYSITFRYDGNDRIYIKSNGTFYPAGDNASDLGTTGNRWRNIYTNDLNLSNKDGANDVDGTWGDFTIQEGESDLFLINNRSGKKYKFNLTEVS